MKKTELIKPSRYYSILMIFKLDLFDWINSYDALKRLIIRDVNNKNKTFKAIVYGSGSGKRYLIKGSTLITVLKKVEKGVIFNHK